MDPSDVNAELWAAGRHLKVYANRVLAPVEVLILARYRDALAGRVLEVGCGAGRVLGYLAELAVEAHGVDLSPAMVAYCRSRYPRATVQVGDAAALERTVSGRFDAILAMSNLLDVFGDAERRRVLAAWRELLHPAGLLIFSSHNLASLEGDAGNGAGSVERREGLLHRALQKPPAEVVRALGSLPRRRRNHRRLAPLERREADYAIVNDETFDFGLLHYYVRPDDQRRQLEELGYELMACIDPDGRELPPGTCSGVPWMHYVARPDRAALARDL